MHGVSQKSGIVWADITTNSRCLGPTYSFQPRNGIGNTADIPTINFAIPNSDSRLQMRMTGRALACEHPTNGGTYVGIVRRYRLGQGLSHLSLRLPSSTSRACPARKGLRVFQEYMRSGLLASIDTSRTVGGMGEYVRSILMMMVVEEGRREEWMAGVLKFQGQLGGCHLVLGALSRSATFWHSLVLHKRDLVRGHLSFDACLHCLSLYVVCKRWQGSPD